MSISNPPPDHKDCPGQLETTQPLREESIPVEGNSGKKLTNGSWPKHQRVASCPANGSQLPSFLSPEKHNDTWTKITILHLNKFTNDEIFNEIFPALFNKVNFYPCFYQCYDRRDEFYLYKNFEALQALEENKLRFMLGRKKILFVMHLNAAKFEDGKNHPFWCQKIVRSLFRRNVGNTLDLNDFATDPEFTNISVLLNLQHNLKFITDFARMKNHRIDTILLQNNRIASLEGQFLAITSLKRLDLRHNQIRTLEGGCESVRVTELSLDDNPICKVAGRVRYKKVANRSKSYIQEVRGCFSHLEWLDGCRVDELIDLTTSQNYLVHSTKCSLFAEEFVKDFFSLYDSVNRKKLIELYKENSIFTINVSKINIGSKGLTQQLIRVARYRKFSRNLTILSDFSKASENLIYGAKAIEQVFENLVPTKHDCKHFCIDVPVISEEQVMITVTGAFEEKHSNFQLSFTRTFILQLNETYQYTIANDQLLINKTSQTQRISFTRAKRLPRKAIKKVCGDLLPNDSEEKKLMIVIFMELTELSEVEAINKLHESQWDLKLALTNFSNLNK